VQYQVTSTQGGTFSFGVKADSGVYSLIVDVGSPTTNLAPGSIGKPVSTADPFDSVSGTVWFHLTKDDFDYFVNHAYGSDGTGQQNFNDFALQPHSWLHLTVEPHVDQKYVKVSFDVMGLDGNRTPVAQAPASILAGSLFQTLVDRNMTTMLTQEQMKAGSSTPWRVPFYYDAPVGGGVVEVIAQGDKGIFAIAYAVESPHHTLKDVPFVPYEDVVAPPPDPSKTLSCDKLGNNGIVLAKEGAFAITFTVSDVVKHSAMKPPLKGTIACSVYNAADVDVSGPKKGVKALQDFAVYGADLDAPPPPTFLTAVFPDGDYQVLCFQDLKGDGTADVGDPVTLPIGKFPLACNLNPITVQFALLNPVQQ
jgi:hypothetical protein